MAPGCGALSAGLLTPVGPPSIPGHVQRPECEDSGKGAPCFEMRDSSVGWAVRFRPWRLWGSRQAGGRCTQTHDVCAGCGEDSGLNMGRTQSWAWGGPSTVCARGAGQASALNTWVRQRKWCLPARLAEVTSFRVSCGALEFLQKRTGWGVLPAMRTQRRTQPFKLEASVPN